MASLVMQRGAESDEAMDRLAPSAYHDPREVVWKHLVAQAYGDILDTLRADGAAIVDYDALRHAFLKTFNGQHDVEALCGFG